MGAGAGRQDWWREKKFSMLVFSSLILSRQQQQLKLQFVFSQSFPLFYPQIDSALGEETLQSEMRRQKRNGTYRNVW